MDLKTYIATSERGTAARLAAELGVSPSYLSQMASGASPISPERAVQIENFTKQVVGRKDMFRNDWAKIWPELSLACGWTGCERRVVPDRDEAEAFPHTGPPI